MKRFAIFAVCSILIITATLYFVFRSPAESTQAREDNNAVSMQEKKIAAMLSARNVAQKSHTESASSKPDAKPATADQQMPIAKPIPPEMPHAQQQPADPNLNPHVESVVEAVKTGSHPERLTSAIKPKPFDKTAYEKNPQAYLDVCEPGRIWDTALPGPDIKQIEEEVNTVIDMKSGESVKLKALAVPGAPVTFTSFDWGEFQNKLTSITVKADPAGHAEATFTATPGTIGHVEIIAASPLTSGQINFKVEIKGRMSLR
jgi:hypothetical protein